MDDQDARPSSPKSQKAGNGKHSRDPARKPTTGKAVTSGRSQAKTTPPSRSLATALGHSAFPFLARTNSPQSFAGSNDETGKIRDRALNPSPGVIPVSGGQGTRDKEAQFASTRSQDDNSFATDSLNQYSRFDPKAWKDDKEYDEELDWERDFPRPSIELQLERDARARKRRNAIRMNTE